MSEKAFDEPIHNKPIPFGLTVNPVFLYGLRSRMRHKSSFVLLIFSALIVAAAAGIFFLTYWLINHNGWIGEPGASEIAGRLFYWGFWGIQLLGMTILAPGIMAGSISSEREQKTLDLLRTSALATRSLVMGKFFSNLLFIILWLAISIPLQCLFLLFGRVTFEEILLGSLILIGSTASISALGLFISSIGKNSILNGAVAYTITLISAYIVPLIFIIITLLLIFTNQTMGDLEQLLHLPEPVLAGLAWVIIFCNPITSLAGSEWVWTVQHSLINASYAYSYGGSLSVLSPWIPFFCISILSTFILLLGSIYFTGKEDR